MFSKSTLQIVEAALCADQNSTSAERTAILSMMRNPTAEENPERLVSIKNAAKLLAIHEKSVWRLVREDRLHVVAIGQKCRRVRLSELESIMSGSFVPSRSYAPMSREA